MKFARPTVGAGERATALRHHVNHAMNFGQHISRHSGQLIDGFKGRAKRRASTAFGPDIGDMLRSAIRVLFERSD